MEKKKIFIIVIRIIIFFSLVSLILLPLCLVCKSFNFRAVDTPTCTHSPLAFLHISGPPPSSWCWVFYTTKWVFNTTKWVFNTTKWVFNTTKWVFNTTKWVFNTTKWVFNTTKWVFNTTKWVFNTTKWVFNYM